MKGIIWLASYPKSGNTWFRIFLTNLLRNGDEPAHINDLESTPIASAPFPICPLRYEDMKREPLETFTRAVRFAGLPYSEEQIQKALEFSSFDVVQKQEEAKGFQ